jgi:PAS domain S-box-containing protein
MTFVAVAPGIPADEEQRLEALRDLGILDTPTEDRFDRITALATRLFDVPVAMVSLIDSERQWVKACVGLPRAEIPRTVSFCGHAILGDTAMVVPDTIADRRFADNPLVVGPPNIRFYAGQPIRTPSGHKVGTLCIGDSKPREFTEEGLADLRTLAGVVESELRAAELSRALAAHRESEELVRALLRATVEGVLGLDLQGRITFANPAAAQLLGWEPDEMIGRVGHDLFHHSHPDGTPYPRSECPTLRVLAHGDVVHLDDVFWRRDGSSFPAESLTAPLVYDGRIGGAVATFRDVRERREVDRLKDEFASVVGHELRTPLTSIRASLGLLGGGTHGSLPGDAQTLVDTALANTDRLVRLINDILDLERLSAGAARLDLRTVEVADLLREATSVLAPMAAEAGVTLVARPGSARVVADPDRAVQALTNLLSNAIKFSVPGQQVELDTSVTGDEVVVSVTDHGRGIPAELHATIFERFAQVDVSDVRDRGGTGLGLSIARGIVESHGGRIWVESDPGHGARFAFTLRRAGDG